MTNGLRKEWGWECAATVPYTTRDGGTTATGAAHDEEGGASGKGVEWL